LSAAATLLMESKGSVGGGKGPKAEGESSIAHAMMQKKRR